jgi:hypothetical protein
MPGVLHGVSWRVYVYLYDVTCCQGSLPACALLEGCANVPYCGCPHLHRGRLLRGSHNSGTDTGLQENFSRSRSRMLV